MLTRKLIGILGFTPLFYGSVCLAQDPYEEAPKTFKVSANVDASRVDNANLETDSELAVSELQTQASLLALGGLRYRFVDLQTDYALNSRHYSEFSERDDDLLLGQSSLRVGSESRRQYLEFSHSSNEITINPQLSNLPSNRETRTILTANAFSSMRLGTPNLIAVQVNTSDFEFKQNFENEATSVGYGTFYARQVSPLHQVGVSVSGYNLDYRYVDEQLDYRQAVLFLKGDLRYTSYSVRVGSNSMERLNHTQSSPLLDATWAYKKAGHTFTVSASQKLSDTSHGSGATVDSGREAGIDGRVEVRDQFKLTAVALNWRHDRPCDRCSLELGIDMQEEDYQQFTEFSSREVGLRLGLGYRLNASVSLMLDGTLGTYTATQVDDYNDSKNSQVVVSVAFPRLIRDGSVSMYAGAQERNFDLTSGYSSNFIGARLQYLLLDR